MRNFREVLEKEQVKELLTKIKGEEKKQKKTILWVILAAVAVSAIVAFLVVRYFTEHDCCECDCDDDFDYLEDDDEIIEEIVEEEILDAAEEAAEETPEVAEEAPETTEEVTE